MIRLGSAREFRPELPVWRLVGDFRVLGPVIVFTNDSCEKKVLTALENRKINPYKLQIINCKFTN